MKLQKNIWMFVALSLVCRLCSAQSTDKEKMQGIPKDVYDRLPQDGRPGEPIVLVDGSTGKKHVLAKEGFPKHPPENYIRPTGRRITRTFVNRSSVDVWIEVDSPTIEKRDYEGRVYFLGPSTSPGWPRKSTIDIHPGERITEVFYLDDSKERETLNNKRSIDFTVWYIAKMVYEPTANLSFPRKGLFTRAEVYSGDFSADGKTIIYFDVTKPRGHMVTRTFINRTQHAINVFFTNHPSIVQSVDSHGGRFFARIRTVQVIPKHKAIVTFYLKDELEPVGFIPFETDIQAEPPDEQQFFGAGTTMLTEETFLSHRGSSLFTQSQGNNNVPGSNADPLARIKNGQHVDLPTFEQAEANNQVEATVSYENATQYTIIVYLRGPTNKTLRIPRGGIITEKLEPGDYEIAAEAISTGAFRLIPFYGRKHLERGYVAKSTLNLERH